MQFINKKERRKGFLRSKIFKSKKIKKTSKKWSNKTFKSIVTCSTNVENFLLPLAISSPNINYINIDQEYYKDIFFYLLSKEEKLISSLF